MPPSKKPADARLAQARALFDEGVTPLNKIAALLKRSPASFLKLRTDKDWPQWPGHALKQSRKVETGAGKPGVISAQPQAGLNANPVTPDGARLLPGDDSPLADHHRDEAEGQPAMDGADEDAPLHTRALARQVEQGVRRELRAVEKRLGSPRTTTAEVNARILASLVKSLAELRRLDGWAPVKTAQSGTGGLHDNEDNEPPPRSIVELREELAAKLERLRAGQSGV